MGVKRQQGAQAAGKAKRHKLNFFKGLNLPSTSASTKRALGKQDSEPHGGQPAVDSQDSDNVPVTVSCPTLAETEAADVQPLAEPTAVIEVVEPDTDKESHIVMQDRTDGETISDTQIDMDETKAEDMHTGEPEEKPNGTTANIDKTEELPDGFTTPPRAALGTLIAAVDDIDSDPEAIGKYFQKLSGTQERFDKSSADSLEASFDKLKGQFAGLATDAAEPEQDDSNLPPLIAKKKAELDDVVKNHRLDPHSSLAQAFRREHVKDPSWKSDGKLAAENYKVEWAKKQLTTLNFQHTKKESFSRVDTTKGEYKNFSQLVIGQGGICMGGPKNMGPRYGDRASSYKNTYTHIYIYLYISLFRNNNFICYLHSKIQFKQNDK